MNGRILQLKKDQQLIQLIAIHNKLNNKIDIKVKQKIQKILMPFKFNNQ